MRALILLLALFATACGGSQGRYMVDVATMKISEPPTMIVTRAKTPLRVLLLAADVPASVTTSDKSWPIKVKNLRTFVARDVVEAFKGYFKKVALVHAKPPASDDCIVARIKINSLDTEQKNLSTVWWYQGKMSWSVAIRFCGDEEYLFSYGALVTGDHPARMSGEEPAMFKSMFDRAITAFFKEMVDKKVLEEIRKREAGPAAPAPAEQAPNKASDKVNI